MNFGTLSTFLTKINTSIPKGIETPSHDPYIRLETLRKRLEVIPHPGTNFETLGTSLRKIGTSNHRAIETPISLLMVHLFLWRPSGSDWRSFPTPKWTLES